MSPHPTSTIFPLVLHGRVAFASFVPGGVIIDGVIHPSAQAQGVVALNASLPFSSWAVAAAALVESWAEADTPVEMRFRYRKPNPQVRITDGRSMVLLDLQDNPTIRLGPNHDSRPPICA